MIKESDLIVSQYEMPFNSELWHVYDPQRGY